MIDRLKKYLSNEELPDPEVEQLTRALLHAKEDFALKEQWQNKLKQKKNKKKTRNGFLLVLFLIAIATLYFVFNPKEEIPPMQFAENYLQESPFPISQSRGNTATDISLLKAAEAYQNKDYKTAIKLYEGLSTESLLKENEQFFLALSFLNDGNSEKSLQIFQAIEQNKSTSFQFETELKFFLGLNHILLEQNEKALQYLKQITTTNWRRETIEALITKLEKTQ